MAAGTVRKPPQPVELEPGTLYWAPGCPSDAEATLAGDGPLHQLLIDEQPRLRCCVYGVNHFNVKSVATFGPLAIDQVVNFVKLCEEKLAEHKRVLVGTRERGQASLVANGAVLAGAWLVLRTGLSAKEAVARLGETARMRFPCSWSPKPVTTLVSVTPADCLAGMEAAKRLGWLDHRTFDVGRYERDLQVYDCCWLVPDVILVGADPNSTVADPDPKTCSSLVSARTRTMTEQSQQSSVPPPTPVKMAVNTPTGEEVEPSSFGMSREMSHVSISLPKTPSASGSSEKKTDKDEDILSPSKAYGSPALFGREEHESQAPDDFASYLQSLGVKLCVRANKGDESGLKEIGGSYDGALFEAAGLSFYDAPYADNGPCIPPPSFTRGLIERFELAQDPKGAVFIHCKSGFGRSVMYGCCLLMLKYEVSGSALLGWTRLVRPGSVTCTSQEAFLRSLKGKKDVERHLKSDQECCTLL